MICGLVFGVDNIRIGHTNCLGYSTCQSCSYGFSTEFSRFTANVPSRWLLLSAKYGMVSWYWRFPINSTSNEALAILIGSEAIWSMDTKDHIQWHLMRRLCTKTRFLSSFKTTAAILLTFTTAQPNPTRIQARANYLTSLQTDYPGLSLWNSWVQFHTSTSLAFGDLTRPRSVTWHPSATNKNPGKQLTWHSLRQAAGVGTFLTSCSSHSKQARFMLTWIFSFRLEMLTWSSIS